MKDISGLEEAIALVTSPPMDEWGDYKDVEASVKDLFLGDVAAARGLVIDGVIAGLPFVFTYRSNLGKLRVGPDPLELPLYQASGTFETEQDSHLAPQEFISIFKLLVQNLTVAPFPYEFKGRVVRLSGPIENLQVIPTEEEALFRSWGVDPKSAYEALKQPSSELVRVGVSEALQERIFETQEVNATPLLRDFRKFPKPTPRFAKLLEEK